MTDALEAWAEVGRRITHRIEEELRLTKAEVLRRSGLSDKTLNDYMSGRPIRRRDKGRDLCRAVGWTPDSIDRILRGEEPVLRLETVPDGRRMDPDDYEARIAFLEHQFAEMRKELEEARAERQRTHPAGTDDV